MREATGSRAVGLEWLEDAPPPVRIGIVGCGPALGMYFEEPGYADLIDVVACADLRAERAAAAIARFPKARRQSLEELLANDDVEIVLNLTEPGTHGAVTLEALRQGKCVYSEKPLALDLAEARAIVAGQTADCRVACAPDTFLGRAGHLARNALDGGLIGEPRLAVGGFFGAGSAARLSDPTWPGTLPDVGVYYVAWLVFLLGAAVDVKGVASVLLGDDPDESRRAWAARTGVSTHSVAVIEFASGAIASLVIGFGLGPSESPHLELHGDGGVLSVPNPAFFDDGTVRLGVCDDEWRELGDARSYPTSRGAGLVDLAQARRLNREPRCSAELGLHVLEIMLAVASSSEESSTPILSSPERPQPLSQP